MPTIVMGLNSNEFILTSHRLTVCKENGIKTDLKKCIQTLETIFLEVLERREMCGGRPKRAGADISPEEQYCAWLREVYEDVFSRFLLMFNGIKSPAQFQAFDTVMNLLAMEGKFPIEKIKSDEYYFPCERLQQILMRLLSHDVNTKHLVFKFQEVAKHPDVVYYTWKLLPAIVSRAQNPDEVYVTNFLQLVDTVPLPKDKDVDTVTYCGTEDGPPFMLNKDHVCKWMSKTWPLVMKWRYTPANQRKLLILLLEKVIAHLKRPLYLTDYLMNSLDAGGPIGVLALQGMLTLIQSYNLDYPNIYRKLYSMIEPNIFQMKYKPRLFHLTDMFLSSSHLPQQLVAAFTKRLARLTLVAPPQDIHIMLQFIGNLIIRHPGLKKMLVGSPIDPEIASDPYDMDESDPIKSRAMDSFLWEVYNLQRHYLPSVATAANQLVSSPLPPMEWDLGLVLETTEDDLFSKELKKKPKEITLTYEKPVSMKLPQGERLQEYWSLT